MESSFLKRQREWDRFARWQLQRDKPMNAQEALHLIGKWTDFFLSRHGRKRSPHPNVQGIMKMHRHLSRLS